MKLTRLSMVGFKSFVDPVDVVIESGLTGIVGPNGCGKSNLVEALRFVMGESSYKAMRGSGMEDVIFSGSRRRPERNTAEVTLHAEVETDMLAGNVVRIPDSGGLEITRRIERDTGSAYRINGRDVRARDVQLLFADAATGARSAALVRQGRINEIISAKPVQRRGILEDAAGISGLHARRHEAELKLNAAEQNMERLDDVLAEITAQHEALKRQARQAVRYRNISGDIRRTEACALLLRYRAAGARLLEVESALREAVGVLGEATAGQGQAARDEAVAGERLPGLRERAAEAGAALQHVKILLAELDREEARLSERRSEIADRMTHAAADLEREQEIRIECEAALARHSEEMSELQQGEDERERRLADASAKAAAAGRIAAERSDEFSRMTATLAERRAERAAADRTLDDSRTRLAKLDEERAKRHAEKDSITRERAADGRAAIARKKADEAEAALAAADDAARRAEAALSQAREAETAALEPFQEARDQVSRLVAETQALSDLVEGTGSASYPPVVDALTVAAGYEKALAAALGDDLDAALHPDAPRRWGGIDDAASDPVLPAGAQPLSDLVQGPEEVSRRLRQIGVVDEHRLETLAGHLSCGQRLVTTAGAVFRWDGYRIDAGVPSAAAVRLTQKNRLTAANEEIAGAGRRVSEAEQVLDCARVVRSEMEEAERQSRRQLREARSAVDSALRTAADAERHDTRMDEKLSGIEAGIERLDRERALAVDAIGKAEATLHALAASSVADLDLSELEGRVEAERAAAAEADAEARIIARDEARRRQRLSELVGETQQWRQRFERATARTGELEARRDTLADEAARLDAEPDNHAVRRRELLHRIEQADRKSASAADDLTGAENAHQLAAATARRALEDLSAAREAKAREEERLSAAAEAADAIVARIHELFSVAPDQLVAIAELDEAKPPPDPDQLEKRLERLRAERERLGGVNLRAEQEAREIEERLDTLITERADLEAGVKRLRQAVSSLSREARERLLSAFDEVNGHFQSLFGQLFGGGTAELMLTEADDPLEAGLEITARPPGKKPQVMSLLSGGEQALTALALIFAVFLTNPSPICVLDEVDAPLDDANVERFCNLLDEMCARTDTRFIIVTHNPITMARMNRLFGVTMAERGVSQLVSVDLETAERYREVG